MTGHVPAAASTGRGEAQPCFVFLIAWADNRHTEDSDDQS